MKPLPAPKPGGTRELLRRFLGGLDEPDFPLVLSWITAAFLSSMSVPILLLLRRPRSGENDGDEGDRQLD